jgi:5'-nucleotidase
MEENTTTTTEHIALIDMDATLCDYLTPLIAGLEAARDPEHEPPLPDDLRDNEPDWRHERRRLITSEPGFWRKLEPIPAGFKILEVIKDAGFKPHILTKGPSNKPYAWKEKLEWCREHLDEDTPVTITEVKGIAYGRILFDDWPEYFLPWLKHRPRGLVIALAHHWNEHITHPNVVRYDGNNLEEIKRAVAAAHARADGEELVL